jgi:lipopolysaccharide biosynthesis protein
LLRDPQLVQETLDKLSEGAAMVGPGGHFVSLKRYMGANESHLAKLLTSIYGDEKAMGILKEPGEYGFFASTMFWCRLDSIRPLLNLHLLPEDFESESGQIDGTLAHGIERLLTLILQVNGQDVVANLRKKQKNIGSSDAETNYKFAP